MKKGGHTYQVTLQPMQEEGAVAPVLAPLAFAHHSHDDLALIVELMRQTTDLDADDAVATAIGTKLLGSVMLKQKDNPLFDGLRQPVREFILSLKALRRKAATE